MKNIPKNLLDTAIDAARGYYDGAVKLDTILNAERAVARDTNGDPTVWGDLFMAIIPRHGGLKPDATNEDIYAVLNVLGYEVV